MLDLLKSNLKYFHKLEKKLQKNPNIKNALRATNFAIKAPCSIYYSEIIEKFFIDLANKTKQIPENYNQIKIKKKHYLHVMSQSYLSGGHTRVVERWIKSANNDEMHSVILLNQKNHNQIPDILRNNITSKNGKLVILNNSDSIINKANQLRNIASEYDAIILYHHMNDPIPLMSFCVKEFQRPVIIFNHAGHLFWLGRNIVDYVIDIEKGQNTITREKRGIQNTKILNMPLDNINQETFISPAEKNRIRERLGFDKDVKIIMSMASEYKFNPIDGYNFIDMIRNVLTLNKDVIFIAIGVNNDNKEWNVVKSEFKDRIKLLGIKPNTEVKEYLMAADLFLDSFPFNSWVSIIDAINLAKLPVLSLTTPTGNPPFLDNTESVCDTVHTLIFKINTLLNDELLRAKFADELFAKFIRECDPICFQKNISSILGGASLNKKNQKCFTGIEGCISDMDLHNLYISSRENKKSVFKIFGIEYYKMKSKISTRKFIKLFGLQIFLGKSFNF